MSTSTPSKAAHWSGLILSALTILGLTFSAVIKLTGGPGLDEGMAHLGIPLPKAAGIGILELTCALLYAIPRTSVLGAILVTAYLGGATAIHVRVDDPFIATVIMGVLAWGGLFLRDPRIRSLIPLRQPAS